MDVDSVAIALRKLNGDQPAFNPSQLEERQINAWKYWSGAEALICKWEEQARKRSDEHHGAKKKKAAQSTSTRRRPSAALELLTRPVTS